MGASPKVIESGIEPKRDFGKELVCEARKIGDLIEAQLRTFFEDLILHESFALDRLREWTPTDRLMTVKEVAAYTGFEARTIDGYTSPGKPPLIQFVKIGGEKRFRKLWVDAAIDSGSIKPRGVVKL